MRKKYGKERAMRREEIVEISAFLAPKSAPNGKEKTKMLEEIVSSVYLNRKALKDGILSCKFKPLCRNNAGFKQIQ